MSSDSEDSSGKRCAFMTVGIIVMIGGFFGGFMQFFWVDTHDVGTILFYVLVVPMISFILGFAIMMYGMKDSLKANRFGMFGMMSTSSPAPRERSFIHEPPRFCKDCGASLSAETIEWVGPLTIKCPYCGASHATEKREV
ncbi:MAG: hypothetical protein E4H14_02905 [Candidatus Thorarchaeota archaeon]|nr:MAG: hypothetical protein E4H14_02905 [Candidatus Thorarchaeota archaeon]